MRRWEVDTTLLHDWIIGLDEAAQDSVLSALEYLANNGPTAGRPFVDRIHHSRHQNMKELRPRSPGGSRQLRILFAFDLQSHAITLVAGDKTRDWNKWYRDNVPAADDLFDRHLEQTTEKKKQKKQRKGKRR